MKLWTKALKNWVEKPSINNGITIPYLLGIYKDKNIDINLKDLFEEFKESKENIIIYHCNNLDEIIISIRPEWINRNNKLIIEKSLFIDISAGAIKNIDTYCDILSSLESIYVTKHFDKNEYSKNQDVWGSFSDIDMEFIDSL